MGECLISVNSIRDGGNGRVDGIGNIGDIVLIQSRHADSSRFQQVNVEFIDQQQNLFLCKTKQAGKKSENSI